MGGIVSRHLRGYEKDVWRHIYSLWVAAFSTCSCISTETFTLSELSYLLDVSHADTGITPFDSLGLVPDFSLCPLGTFHARS